MWKTIWFESGVKFDWNQMKHRWLRLVWFESSASCDSNHKSPNSNQVKSLIRVRVFEKLCFVAVQFDLSQGMYLILIKYTKSQFFITFKRFWFFSFHLTWTNNTHGSYSINSCHWLKPLWPNLKYNNWFMHA